MNWFPIVATFLLLIQTLYTLHLDHNHFDTNQYLDQLKDNQNTLTSSIQSLEDDISNTEREIKAQIDISEKIRKLEEAINRQKKMINSMAIDSIAPLESIDIICPNLNVTSISQLQSIAKDLQSSSNSLKDTIDRIDSEKTTDELKTNVQIVSDQTNAVNEILENEITTKNPQEFEPIWISNLAADNWSRNNLTIDQINEKFLDKSDNADTVKYCAIETPFYDGNQCIRCDEGKYFDLVNQKCIQCDNYDQIQRKCVKTQQNPTFMNLDQAQDRLILPPGTTYNDLEQEAQNNQNTICPNDRPFFTGSECVQCFEPNTLFNYTSRKCSKCPQNSIYEPNKGRCLEEETVLVTNYAAAPYQIIVPDDKNMSTLLQEQQSQGQANNLESCPQDQPFFNGEQCILCDKSLFFEIDSLECKECPDGTQYSKAQHRCQKVMYFSNLANSNWTSTNPEQVENRNQEQSKNSSYIQCPIQKPFYDGSSCIVCEAGKTFSFDASQCTKCSPPTVFSITIHQCVTPTFSYQTNPLTAPNIIYGGISKNEWSTKYYQNLQENPNMADCPEQRPYFDGSICVKCPDTHPFFNLRYKLCHQCSQGSEYDKDSRQCLSEQGTILDQAPTLQKMAAGIFS